MAVGVLATAGTASADVGAAFDNHGRAINNCYSAKNGAKMCVQFISDAPHVRTASVLHVGDAYPVTLFANCDTGRWEFFGPATREQGAKIASQICK